jgi:hypothetical protein
MPLGDLPTAILFNNPYVFPSITSTVPETAFATYITLCFGLIAMEICQQQNYLLLY